MGFRIRPIHTPTAIRARRLAMLDGGWAPLAVHGPRSPYAHNPGKQPVKRRGQTPDEQDWRRGHSAAQLAAVRPFTSNTGLLCDGLRVLDLDIDDPGTAAAVLALLTPFLPARTLIRRREGSPRVALIARADGCPSKRILAGAHGKVEVLGAGQQVLVDGEHPGGGCWFFTGPAPWQIPLADLPVMPESAVLAALSGITAAGLLGAPVAASGGGGGAFDDGRRQRLQDLKTIHRGDIERTAEALLAEAGEGNRHNSLVTAAGFLVAKGWRDDAVEELLAAHADGWDGPGWDYHVDKAIAHARKRTAQRQGRWIMPGGQP